MGVREVVSVLRDVPVLLALKKGMKPRPLDEQDCLGALVERTARNFGTATAVVSEGESVTWGDLNARANRYAHFLKGAGLGLGDTVSIMMENRIEFLALLIATNKLGVTAGLINTNLRGRPLIHCVNVTESKKCVFGGEVGDAIEEAKGALNLEQGADYFVVPDGASNGAPASDWSVDMAAGSANLSVENPQDTGEMTLGRTAMYIFTSGTTGLPKAAVVSNRRYLTMAGLSATAGLRCTSNDRIYICLPLYHGTALMVGAGAAFASGASMFLRRRFSASSFLSDAREHGCTSFIYVGEMCRYLNNSEPRADDRDSPLHTMMGNGLRPDIWTDFKRRYGIERVTEFYGASEGNVAFANLMNKDCTIGMTSSKIALVRYDVDADEIVRGGDGRCIETEPGEPGLLLGHINPTARFEGYTDPDSTESKILRDVLEAGDAWFNTGDLIRQVDVGFSLGYPHYQFVDRTGDTFRWKSENVSTNEVGEIINGFEGIEFCNVYGVEVPGADGRAGMAAVRLTEGRDLDLAGLAAYVGRELPPYARPVFVRVQSEIEVTGTFKMVKGDLKQDGFDISKFDDPVYVMKPGSATYEALAPDYLTAIRDGAAGF